MLCEALYATTIYYSKYPHFKKEYMKFLNLIGGDKFEEAAAKLRGIAKHQLT